MKKKRVWSKKRFLSDAFSTSALRPRSAPPPQPPLTQPLRAKRRAATHARACSAVRAGRACAQAVCQVPDAQVHLQGTSPGGPVPRRAPECAGGCG